MVQFRGDKRCFSEQRQLSLLSAVTSQTNIRSPAFGKLDTDLVLYQSAEEHLPTADFAVS
jgi:hypothetical protein